VYVAERGVAEAIVGFDMHRGVLALGERGEAPTLASVVGAARCLLVLEGLSNHDNVGSLYRSLSALGPAGSAVVLGPGCADPFYRKSLRVSMGHVLRLPTAWAGDWPGDVRAIAEAGFRTVALTPDAGSVALGDVRLRCPPERLALMVGAEGPGLTQGAKSAAELAVRITMNESVDSLNVGVAAAVALAGLCVPGGAGGNISAWHTSI
jgi:tRNA G18 (ribose-2'-O)-methylase SpoU